MTDQDRAAIRDAVILDIKRDYFLVSGSWAKAFLIVLALFGVTSIGAAWTVANAAVKTSVTSVTEGRLAQLQADAEAHAKHIAEVDRTLPDAVRYGDKFLLTNARDGDAYFYSTSLTSFAQGRFGEDIKNNLYGRWVVQRDRKYEPK